VIDICNIFYLNFAKLLPTIDLPAFQSAILIVSKYGARHTEAVYAHQASIFHAIEARGTHLTALPRHFVPKDQNKLCTHDKNRKLAELWVKIYLFHNICNV